MESVNYIIILIGIIVTIIGVLSFIFPGLTRLINAPGNERIKSIITTTIGIIIIIVGLFFR